MNKSLLLVLTAIIASVIFGSSPQNAFAQRGGHGGGGGFHGGRGMSFSGGGAKGFYGGAVGRLHSGGGHYGYRNGYFYGGHYGIPYGSGRGYYGYHVGYGPHGGYRRYPYYGVGWGWGFGWPYWGWGLGYGYGYYGYNPWYSAPYLYYSYPDYCSPGYSCPPNGNDNPPPADSSPKPGPPAKPRRPDESTPDTDDGSRNASATSHGSVLSAKGAMVLVSNGRVANSTTQGYTPVRPEVQNAMRALREMPPFARLREIETGRYSHLNAEERALLRSVK